MASRTIGAGVFAVLLGCGAAAQPMPDCRQAKTETEKAICGNAELATADKAMAEAYAALEKTLPDEERSILLDDQRQWLMRRGAQCVMKQEGQVAQCLLMEIDQRRRFFAGEGPNNTNGAPLLQPRFYAEKGRYRIAIVYPRAVGLAEPITAAFDSAVRARTFDALWVKDFGEGEENIRYEATHLDSRLAAIVFENWANAGGAHGFGGRSSLLFDRRQGRELKLPDILADPRAAVPAIAAQCKPRLEREAAALGWRLYADADPASTVDNAKAWAPDDAGVDILFNPHTVAGNVSLTCRLVYSELAQWLKPGGPLPPH